MNRLSFSFFLSISLAVFSSEIDMGGKYVEFNLQFKEEEEEEEN